MKHVATSSLGLLLAFHVCPASANAADANWRRPLTFKDSGFYSGIDDERRFDFYILQWNVQHLPLPWDVRKSDRLVKELRAQGKFAIARLYLWKTHDEQARPIEEYYREVDAVLEKIDTTHLYGVSLSEENIHWKGHGEVLEKLYDYVKDKWPHLLVFQWFSNQPPDVIDPDKADGYIIDPYGFRERKFLPFLKKNLSFGKPVINVVFIANQGGTWNWSPAHFRAFEDQWRICREHDVPVGHGVGARFRERINQAESVDAALGDGRCHDSCTLRDVDREGRRDGRRRTGLASGEGDDGRPREASEEAGDRDPRPRPRPEGLRVLRRPHRAAGLRGRVHGEGRGRPTYGHTDD